MYAIESLYIRLPLRGGPISTYITYRFIDFYSMTRRFPFRLNNAYAYHCIPILIDGDIEFSQSHPFYSVIKMYGNEFGSTVNRKSILINEVFAFFLIDVHFICKEI